MKKLSVILICFLLLVPAFFLPVQAAAGKAELVADAAMVQPGGTIEFTAYLENYPQVDSLSITVTVPEGLTVQSGKWLLIGLEDYGIQNGRGIWGSSGVEDLSQRVAVFKLVCMLDPNAAASQVSDYEVTVNFGVKAANQNQGSCQASATVGRAIPATSLELNKQALSFDLSGTKTAQITATYTPADTTDELQWSSTNEAVATVSPDGTVTALAEGNATIVAKIGNLTKVCQVTVSCGHSSMEEHKENEPTCKNTGNNLYYVCKTCGDVFKADKVTPTTVELETLAVVDHAGGTASCSQQALCKWCQQPYGATLPHNFKEKIEDDAHFVAGSGADCQTAKKYHYDCTECNAIGAETFDSAAKGNHKMSAAWTTENGKHFHECTVSGCTHTTDTETCSGGTATCTAKAVCSTCRVAYGETLLHNFKEKIEDDTHFVTGSGADCQTAKKYYYDCTECNTIGTETFDGTTKGNHKMSAAWTTENGKHFHECTVSGCTHTTGTETCSGGTATCTAKAVCSTCRVAYGSSLGHNFKEKIEDTAHLVAGSGADCQSVKKYYYDCTRCSAKGTTIFDSTQKGDHKMSAAWTTENGKHFHKCTVSGCTHTTGTETCSGGTATCTAKAVCSTCRVAYGSSLGHNFKEKIEDTAHLVAGSGADCQSVKKYYYDCTRCSAKGTTTFDSTQKGDHKMSAAWTTENGKHFHKCTVSGCTHTTGTETCSGGTATCTAKAVCSTCGVGYGALKSHTYGSTWSNNGTGDNNTHYLLCTQCRTAKDKEAKHTFIWVTDTPATENTVGEKHEECTVCKVKRNVGTEIPKLPHVHDGITYHNAVAATCVATGNVKYWTCSSSKCAGKYFEDENCAKELATVTTPINPDNHTGTQVKDTKAPTCYQEGYTGDTYCTATGCGKKLASGKAIPATGKHVAGTEWFSDSAEHWHSCVTAGCTAKVDKNAHNYQWKLDKAATEDAVGLKHEECACGAKRSEGTQIPKLDHVHVDIKHHEAVKATCTKEGFVEYWTCSSGKCAGKYYGDKDCQLELQSIVEPIDKDNHIGDTQLKGAAEATCGKDGYTGDTYCVSCQAQVQKGEVILATGKHTPKADYDKDGEQHWKTCSDCGALIDNRKEEHALEWVVDVKPTETEEGKKHQVCTVCGHVCNENTSIEKLPHEPVYVDGKAPTCTEGGIAGYFLCQNCGKYFASKDGKPGEEIKEDSIKLPATGHSFGSEWKHNEKEHWNECACGETGNKAAHTTELVNAKEATLTETGYTGDKVCSVCGYVVEKGEEIPVLKPETKVEISEGGITAVPETLQQAGLKTPEEVKDAIVEAMKEQSSEIVKENVVHYDVTLQFSQDGGKTWIKADEQHFPENGKLTVVLPYPEGTDATYTFQVAHMFTSSAFGKKPGDVEFPTVTNTKEGIEFEVTGLSPISVGWTAPATETPPTGDQTIPVVFAGILALGLVAGAVVFFLKKKRAVQ